MRATAVGSLNDGRSSEREAQTVNEPPQQDSLRNPAELEFELAEETRETDLAPRSTRLRVVLLLSVACWLVVLLAGWLISRLL